MYYRLKRKYRKVCMDLGQTGAGLSYNELLTSPFKNLLGEYILISITIDTIYIVLDEKAAQFPWFSQLHGFWCTIPNFNPIRATSHPDQNLKEDAMTLLSIMSRKRSADEVAAEDDQLDNYLSPEIVDDTNIISLPTLDPPQVSTSALPCTLNTPPPLIFSSTLSSVPSTSSAPPLPQFSLIQSSISPISSIGPSPAESAMPSPIESSLPSPSNLSATDLLQDMVCFLFLTQVQCLILQFEALS
jgi:hypothetical protein